MSRRRRRPAALADLARHLPEQAPLARVERRGRLVEEEDVRAGEEGDGEVEALLVPGGELGGQAAVVGEVE